MSRSNPSDSVPNPCERRFEWDGQKGVPRYYDRDAKATIVFPKPDCTFLVLDQTSKITGWHERSKSSIMSNEVRDTRAEPFLVKAWKGGELAVGLYAQIKDRVAAVGGQFMANIYCAYKEGDTMKLGAFQFKGAALGAWMEFVKEARKAMVDVTRDGKAKKVSALYVKAVRITGNTKGKKGSIEFYVPNFRLTEVSAETDAAANELDKVLQDYLTAYFKRTRVEQAATAEEAPQEESSSDSQDDGPPNFDNAQQPDSPEDSGVPF